MVSYKTGKHYKTNGKIEKVLDINTHLPSEFGSNTHKVSPAI